MPHLMIVADEHECLFVKWSGALSLEGRRDYAEALEALTPAEAAYRRFHDVRDAVLDVPTEDVAAAARYPGKASEAPVVRVPSAILVASELGYGMMRMFETLYAVPGLDIKVFRDLDEAKQWLGLEIPGDPFADLTVPD